MYYRDSVFWYVCIVVLVIILIKFVKVTSDVVNEIAIVYYVKNKVEKS